jgi:hypothetical protein
MQKTQHYEKETNEHSIYSSSSCNAKRGLRADETYFAAASPTGTTSTGKIIYFGIGICR